MHKWRPTEDTVRTQLQARERGLTRNQPCQHLDSGLPAPTTVRKHISLAKQPSLQYCYGNPRRLIPSPNQFSVSVTASFLTLLSNLQRLLGFKPWVEIHWTIHPYFRIHNHSFSLHYHQYPPFIFQFLWHKGKPLAPYTLLPISPQSLRLHTNPASFNFPRGSHSITCSNTTNHIHTHHIQGSFHFLNTYHDVPSQLLRQNPVQGQDDP